MGSIIRALSGTPVAFVVTAFLFLLMYGLIRVTVLPATEDREDVNINFSRTITESQVVNQKVFEKPTLDQPPPPPPRVNTATFTPNVSGPAPSRPSFEASVDIGSGFNPDRDAQPLVRIPPRETDFQRCIRSNQQRTEVVRLQFNVDPQGNVYDVKAVDSTDSCYDRAAIRSAERWKYQPKVVEGNNAPRIGVQTTIQFQVGG